MPTRLAPKLDDEVTETVDDGGILAKARLAVDGADGADPLRYAIEFSELALEGSEDRKGGQASRLVGLICREVAADESLHKRRRSIEGTVPSDVGKPVVDLDQLEVSRRGERRRERQAQLIETTFDLAHSEETNAAGLGSRWVADGMHHCIHVARLSGTSLKSNPPPPLKALQGSCNISIERRQIGRRLCVTGEQRSSQRLGELVELYFVCVELCGVDTRVTEQWTQCGDIAAAFTEEPVSETVPQLVRRKLPHAGTPAETLHHTPERLVARWHLRVLTPPLPAVLRHPLFNLDGEHVIVELGLKFPETPVELPYDVLSERKQ